MEYWAKYKIFENLMCQFDVNMHNDLQQPHIDQAHWMYWNEAEFHLKINIENWTKASHKKRNELRGDICRMGRIVQRIQQIRGKLLFT